MTKITSKTFADLGFRTMPIGKVGYTLVRDEDGKKHIKDKAGKVISFKQAMPAEWTKKYGNERTEHADTPLGGLICGQLENKSPDEIECIALDCDNEAAWVMLTAMDPDYQFKTKSVGKPGGTIIYELPEALYELKQYSINNGTIALEYMAKRESGPNAMIYLPTTANETKGALPKGTELSTPPESIIVLIKSLKPQKPKLDQPRINENASAVLPFNAPLVKQYVLETKAKAIKDQVYGVLEDSPIAEKVYSIFTPKKFRTATEYEQNGWLHPNSSVLTEIAPYSEYITGLSAIAGADPSIDIELYIDFMQAINAQLDEPYTSERYLHEVIHPMIYSKASINGKPIWQYNENWDKNSHSISNQYGETLEYFANEIEANEFLEYNHTTTSIVRTKGVSALLDRIYTMDADPQQEKPSRSLVKKLKLMQEEHTVKLPAGIYMNEKGRTIINTTEACLPLKILRQPEIFEQEVSDSNLYVQAFITFLRHLTGDDDVAIDYMLQVLAYHGYNLTAIPVIIYMVGIGGSGKSEFSNILEELFGSNTTRRPGAKQLTSQYNDFLDGCALLVLTETSDTSYRDREGMKSVLKTVTGEKSIDIETKHKPLRANVPLLALPLMLANELWYEEDDNDRRLFTINPQNTVTESHHIAEFEEEHDVRIISFIIEGVREGFISKWLSKYRPEALPAVPLTQDKILSSAMQGDSIKALKSLVTNKQYKQLIDLFDEYDITQFFTLMNIPEGQHSISSRNHLYINTLVQLAIEMRGTSPYPTDSQLRQKFLPRNWPAAKGLYKRHSTNKGPTNYREVGTHKWEAAGLIEAFEKWSLNSMKESTDGDL